MKRTFAALLIPAALIMSGCASNEPEADSRQSVTSTLNVLDGLALPPETSVPKVTTAPKATTTKPASRDIYGVTPDGLTTSVNVPIPISATEVHQGCVEMQAWAASMDIADPETILAISQLTEDDSTEGFTVESDEDGVGGETASPSEQAA